MAALNLSELGILKQTIIPKKFEWLSDIQTQVMLSLFSAGEDGIHKSAVFKLVQKDETNLIALDIHGYIEWQKDNRGRNSHLLLTWKGEDVAKELFEVAKNSTTAFRKKDSRESSN